MLKNLLGQNLLAKTSKQKTSKEANSLESANLLDKTGKGSSAKEKKGLHKEFSKLLGEGQSKNNSKGQKNLLATNVAKELSPKLKGSKLGHEGIHGLTSESKHVAGETKSLDSAPKSLFSIINKQDSGPKSDVDNILGTKNIVSLQKAKTALANQKEFGVKRNIPSKELPNVVSKGISSTGELGANTKGLLEDISKTESNLKDDVQLRIPNKSLTKGINSKLNLQNQNSDFFMANRSLGSNVQQKEIATKVGLNKFSKEANLKNSSIIKAKSGIDAFTTKSGNSSSNLRSEDNLGLDTPKAEAKSSLIQNNLIGALGSDNSSSNFKPQINLAKTSEVLDLSAVTNSDQIIKEVTNYIEMNRIENGKSLQMLVKHDQLGHFNITANKEMNGMVALNIEAQSLEAKEFFKENEVKLLKNLDMKGIRVADFKIQTATSGQMSDTASQADSFNKERKDSQRRINAQADKISTLENSGIDSDFTRQLDSEDSFAFDKNARERRQQRWQEYSQRIGA